MDLSRTRRESGVDSSKNMENLERYQTEMENYAVYKPVNSLLLEVTKCQEEWNRLNATMDKAKRKLSLNNIDFKKFVTSSSISGCESVLKSEETKKMIEVGDYALGRLSSPIDDFSLNINDTLNHFKPQLLVFKELMTFHLNFCEANELESCKEKIVKWSDGEIQKYKMVLNDVKEKINETVKVFQKISDELRNYKYDVQNYLQEKKKAFECCRIKSVFGIITSCSYINQFDFKPLEFSMGNPINESSIDNSTKATPTTKDYNN